MCLLSQVVAGGKIPKYMEARRTFAVPPLSVTASAPVEESRQTSLLGPVDPATCLSTTPKAQSPRGRGRGRRSGIQPGHLAAHPFPIDFPGGQDKSQSLSETSLGDVTGH